MKYRGTTWNGWLNSVPQKTEVRSTKPAAWRLCTWIEQYQTTKIVPVKVGAMDLDMNIVASQGWAGYVRPALSPEPKKIQRPGYKNGGTIPTRRCATGVQTGALARVSRQRAGGRSCMSPTPWSITAAGEVEFISPLFEVKFIFLSRCT